MRIGKLERDIAEAADRGFHVIPRAFIAYSLTNVAIMEKSPSATDTNEYTILDAQKSSTLQEKLSEAVQQGFRPVSMNRSRTMLLDKPVRPAQEFPH